LDEARAAISCHLAELEPFMAALQKRVALALSFGEAHGNGSDQAGLNRAIDLARVLAAVATEMPLVHDIGSPLNAFVSLAQNRANHSRPREVDKILAEFSNRLQPLVDGIQQRLKEFTYPFPHPHGPLTIADYVRYEKPAEFELQRLYLNWNAHVDRLFALHYRLIGRILACVNAAENDLAKKLN
jgi:hypothetical protein